MGRKSKKTLEAEALALAEQALEVLTPEETLEVVEEIVETVEPEKVEIEEIPEVEPEKAEVVEEIQTPTPTKTKVTRTELRKMGLI